MKHIKLIISSVLFMTLASCGEDFLYVAPEGSIDQEALSNEQGAELLITNAYSQLADRIGWGAGPFNWVWGGICGGDANKGSDANDQSVLNSVETYTLVSSNDYLLHKWRFMYRGAKRCNIAINVINSAEDMDASTKTIRIGEMKFLRALYYFEGVKVFGATACPYIDEELAATENDPKAHNGANIYPNIIADIDAAIAALPETQSEAGRANQWAAKALKTKVLMQQGDMASAKPILADIVANGKSPKGAALGLEDNLTQNWTSFDEHGKESIFEVEFTADGSNYNSNYGMCLNYPHNSGPGGCCGFDQPSYELVNSFQVDENGLPYLNGEYRSKKSVTEITGSSTYTSTNDKSIAVDPRLDFAVGRFEIPYKDYGLPTNDWVRDAANGGPFMPKKHVYTQAEKDAGLAGSSFSDGWAPGSAMNIQYLCFRDVLLQYAECLANDGELSAAMEQVNKIRARAAKDVNIIKLEDGTPAANYLVKEYPSSHEAFSNKETCIKAIRMERKLELAMEGQRFFDLVRWGGDYMNSELTAYLNYEKQYISKFYGVTPFSANKTMFPIPLNEIQTMGNDESGQPYLVQSDAWK